MSTVRPVTRSAGFCAIALCAATLFASHQSPVAPQSQMPTFKGRLNIVRTEVDVIDDRTGRPVAGLTQKDFEVSAHFSTMSGQATARESGGLFASVRTAEQQLSRLDAVTRSGYLLGYVPSNPNMDGKYRQIEIKVDRKDVTLVYRRGYTARPDPPPVDPARSWRGCAWTRPPARTRASMTST